MKYLILLLSLAVNAQVSKVEPPFWFSGMRNPELQLMFYGKNIGASAVTVSGGVSIRNVVRTENPNYLFVTVGTADLPPSEVVFTFTSGKKTFRQPYTFRPRRENSANRGSYDASDMIYLLMPDRFANGNAANDNTPATTEKADRANAHGRHGGDIEGIIAHLDYIRDLGATTVWPTPLCEDNAPRGSYHGYAQTDVYRIDPRYGSNDDYLRLSSELHKRGMKLVMDYVTNHWGAEHWMIRDLPAYDWVHQFPGYAQSNYRMTTQFDTNASDIDRKYCVDGWFVRSMPDLNQSNPLVLNYLIQNAIWWIEYADLDGFRVDTYSYNDKDGISKWTKAITDEYPHFNIAGEVWMHDQAQMAYWQKDSRIGAIESYNSHLPTVMDFTLMEAMESAFGEDRASWDKGMIRLYDNFANDFLYPNPNSILVFAENHDTQRFNQRYPDIRKYKMAMAVVATVRGIPQLYYGSEIGMAGNKDNGDGDIRHDFPGGWNGDARNAFTRDGRTPAEQDYFDYTAKLFRWRKGKTVLHTGKTMQYIPENNVYVYFRYNEAETVMVVINNNPDAQPLSTARFSERLKPFRSGTDVISGKVMLLAPEIAIEGKSALILELK
jgi:neopullulanase